VPVAEARAIASSRRIAWTTATKIAIFVLNGVSAVVLSRALKPEGRGAYAVILSIAQMALSLGHLSLEQAHVFFWQFEEDRKSLIVNGVFLGFVIGTAVAVVTGVLVKLLGPDVVPIASFPLLVAALAAVPFSMVVLYANGFFVLSDRIERINKATLAAATFATGAVVVLGVLGRLTVGSVIVIWALSATLPLAFLLPGLKVRWRHLRRDLAAKALGLGLRYHVGMAALFLLFRVDILLLNSRVTRAQVGLYSLAVVLAELTYLLTDSIAQVVLPRQLESSLEESGQFTARVVRTNVVAATAALAAIVASAPLVVPFVFGAEFSDSVPSLAALAPGVLALAIIRPVGGYLVRLNKPWRVSSLTSSALVVNVVLNLLLIPVWGIVGAAVASSCAYLGLALAYLLWLMRSNRLKPGDLVPRWQDLRGPLMALLRKG
jgi:O-antigen/teichoic acid export membrane protein